MAKAVHPQNACRDDMPQGQFRPWTAAGRPAARRRSPTRRIGANRQISEAGLRPRQDGPTAGRARATFPALSGIPIRTALSGSRPAASRNEGWLPEPDLQPWPPTAAALWHRAARSHACARPRARHPRNRGMEAARSARVPSAPMRKIGTELRASECLPGRPTATQGMRIDRGPESA